MGLLFEFVRTENNRRLHDNNGETPANCLVIILEVSTESNKVVADRIECRDCMVCGVSVITVGTTVNEGEGQRQSGRKVDGE